MFVTKEIKVGQYTITTKFIKERNLFVTAITPGCSVMGGVRIKSDEYIESNQQEAYYHYEQFIKYAKKSTTEQKKVTRQLNIGYKRLYKKRMQLLQSNAEQLYLKSEVEMKEELCNLYQLDSGFEFINRLSVLLFFELNRVLKAVPHYMVFPKIKV